MKEVGVTQIDLVKMDLEGLEHELIAGQEEFWNFLTQESDREIGYDKSQLKNCRPF